MIPELQVSLKMYNYNQIVKKKMLIVQVPCMNNFFLHNIYETNDTEEVIV